MQQVQRGPTSIKNLTPALMERGKIKIGEKGQMMKSKQGNDFQPPRKLDHFRITTMERGPDGNFKTDEQLHQMYGSSPKELPVRLLYDTTELNFPTRYSCYRGQQQWCTGDGEQAMRLDQNNKKAPVECPCERIAPDYQGKDKCKVNGCLSCIIDGAETIGGAWKFRTTSYNSVVGILSSLAMIKSITGGPLSGIPLTLRVAPKTVVSPADGRVQTIQVVGLEYKGKMEALRQIGYDLAMDRQKHLIRMEDIEKDARKLIKMVNDPVMDEDVVEEFYPEQVTGETIIDKVDESPEAAFDQQKPAGVDLVLWESYVAVVAKEWEVEIPEMKTRVIMNGIMEGFVQAFENWVKENASQQEAPQAAQGKTEEPPVAKAPAEAPKEKQKTEESGKGVLPIRADLLKDVLGPMRKDRFLKWEAHFRPELMAIPIGDPRREVIDWKWKNTFGVPWTSEGQPGYVAPAEEISPVIEAPKAEEKAPVQEEIKSPEPPPPAEETKKPDPPQPPPVKAQASSYPQYVTCATRGGKRVHSMVCHACMLQTNCKDFKEWQGK